MRYWLVDHNVDGFRLDAVTSYYTGDVNKNVDFLSWLNTTAKSFKPDAYIVGEAWEGNDVIIDRYYDSGCDSFFLFTGAQATGTIATLVKQSSGASLGKLLTNLQNTYTNGVLAPFLGNHDTMRPGSFMPGIENLKMAAGVLSMMNGSVFVYYGEEIGMISKNGSNSDPAKRIAMKWSDKGVYEGWCYISPEGTPVDESSYYYPSVEAQKEDKGSILNYYKQAMRLRNSFPSIARGEVEYFPDGQNNYICVITKTYGEEKITIVFNMDTFEQTVTLDTGLVPANKIVGELYSDISTKASLNGTKLVMPPQSIVILQ
jgi:glycosidase